MTGLTKTRIDTIEAEHWSNPDLRWLVRHARAQAAVVEAAREYLHAIETHADDFEHWAFHNRNDYSEPFCPELDRADSQLRQALAELDREEES